MESFIRFGRFLLAPVLMAGTAHAVITGDSVVSYSGTGDASAALGLPSQFQPSGAPYFDGSLITAFNAPYTPGQMVEIDAGQSLTLHLSGAVPATGQTLGVHAGVGFEDVAYPSTDSRTATNPPAPGTALIYTNPRVANVSFSQDGTNFSNSVSTTFDVPTNAWQGNFYPDFTTVTTNAAPADFGKPFTGTSTDFYDLPWNSATGPSVQSVLDGSGGGTWVNLSGLTTTLGAPITAVNYIRFSVSSDADFPMFVDAVTAVPEPGAICIAVLGGGAILLRRRRLSATAG